MGSIKDYQKLHLKKYRDQFGLFIVEGNRICREALQSNWKIEAVFFEEGFEASGEGNRNAHQFAQRRADKKAMEVLLTAP